VALTGKEWTGRLDQSEGGASRSAVLGLYLISFGLVTILATASFMARCSGSFVSLYRCREADTGRVEYMM